MKDEPLGLPKGSVRAILVLIVAVAAGAALFVGRTEISNKAFDLLKMLIPLYIGVQLPSGRESKGE